MLDLVIKPDIESAIHTDAARLFQSDPRAYQAKNAECREALARVLQGQPPRGISQEYDPFQVAFNRLPRHVTLLPTQEQPRPPAIPSFSEYRSSWESLGATKEATSPRWTESIGKPAVSYDRLRKQTSVPNPQDPTVAASPSLPSTAGGLDSDELVTWSFNLDSDVVDI